MPSRWLSKAKTIPTLMTTYRVGLLQARAFRLLNVRMVALLEPYGIRPLDWALLGAVHDSPEELTPAAIADLLGVKAPHVTVMIRGLKGKGLVVEHSDSADRRKKFIALTPEGVAFIPRVEKVVREGMKELVKGVGVKDVLSYAQVLAAMVANGEQD